MQGIDGRACVGLVLAVSGIYGVSGPLNLGVQMLRLDERPWESLLFVLPLLAVMMQIATGCAFAFGVRRAAWPCFGGYVAAAIGLAIFSVVGLARADNEFSLTPAPVLIEILGPPLLAAIAFAIARPTGGTIRVEAGVLLIVFGITAIAGNAIQVIDLVRILSLSTSGIGGLISSFVVFAAFLVIAILKTRAGLALRRGTTGSDRALGVFVIAALVGQVLLLAVRVASAFFDDRFEEQRAMLISMHTVIAIEGIAIPLVIWAFVRRDRSRHTPVEPRVPMAAAWIALLWVPFLAVRPWVVIDAVTAVFDSDVAVVIAATFAAQALATTVAVGAAVGQWRSAAALAWIATLLGLVTASAIVMMTYLEPGYRPIQTGPLVTLVVAGAVLAWLHRTATGPLARAVIR